MSDKLNKTLKERSEKYGSFTGYCKYASQLKLVIEESRLNGSIDALHAEALDMIFSKIARILNGDPDYVDNWHDIAGYAQLVENEIIKGKSNDRHTA